MKRLFLFFTLSLFTFSVGVASITVWRVVKCSCIVCKDDKILDDVFAVLGSAEQYLSKFVINSDKPQKNELGFEQEYVACGFDKSGGEFSRASYKSSDGIKLETTWHRVSSAAKARQELENSLKSTAQEIERIAERNEQGQITSERVVIKSADKFCLLKVDGREFFRIESVSLKHILTFEKQIRKVSFEN